MSMVVQHNLQAMNANRLLGVTTGQQSKSTEKLSSGFKINRAADDAAGLTISEKMRRQIRGLSQASTNAQDGVSSVQTAEGALTEVHSMLQRMNELATQAANGTQSKNDRVAIQSEIKQLSIEIDRVAETTKFNEIYLLKGGKTEKTVKMPAHDAGLKGKLTDYGNGTATFVMDALKAGDTVNIGGKNYEIISDPNQTEAKEGTDYKLKEGTPATATIDLSNWAQASDSISIGGNTVIAANSAADDNAVLAALQADAGFSSKYTASLDSGTLTITAKDNSVNAGDIVSDFTVTIANGDNITAGAANVEDDYELEDGVDFYAENGTEKLSADQVKEALKNNEKLYTTAAVKGSQTEASGLKHEKAAGASASLDVSGLTGTETITIDGITFTMGTDNDTSAGADPITKQVADHFAQGGSANYDFSVSDDGSKLIITTKATGKAQTGDDLVTALGTFTHTGATAAVKVSDGTDEVKEGDFTKLYAKGGTKALSEEDALKALEAGETLYSTPWEKEDNQITAKEAYALAKKELEKANSIGDTNKTATVKYGIAASDEKTPEKTAADYTVGQPYTIDGKDYTIGDTADKVKAALSAAISDAANTTGASSGNNGTAAKKVGELTDGTTTIAIYTNRAGDAVYDDMSGAAVTLTGTAPAATTTANLTDFDAAMALLSGEITFTPDTANVPGGTPAKAAIADDTTDGSTVISAAKAAELQNAADKAAAEGGDDTDGATNSFTITTASAKVASTLSFNLHVGADADMTNKIQVNIDTMNSAFLGIKDLDLSDEDGMMATYAIDAIQDAISKVSAQRSTLGAIQNRLEHTIANLDNVVENTTSAESRIRDTDMASEMVEYSKNNILAQAGQAMLAQANQSTQGVLSLLG